MRPYARVVAFVVAIVSIFSIHLAEAQADYYKVLGVSRDADERTLKKNYRIQALKHHPDKGGSPEKFAEIGEAYEVLTDPEKRAVYDRYGHEGLKAQQGGGGPGPGDGFGGGFGGGGFGGGGRNVRFEWSGGGPGGGFGGGFGGGDPFADMFGDVFGGRGRGGGRRQQGQQQRPKENLFDKLSPVTSLRQGKFPGTDAKNIWFISFYAPWCGHCREMKGAFEQLAKSLKGLVRVGAVNCEIQKGLCAMEGVNEFPTLKLKKAGVSTPLEQGDHSFQRMRDWVLDHLPIGFANLKKPSMLTKFLENDCAVGRACVVFLNDQRDTPAWFKVASFAHRDIKMAESKGKNSAIGMYFDIVKQPTLVVICDGDIERTVAYSGRIEHDMTSTDVDAWLSSFSKDHSTGCARVKKTPKTGANLDRTTDLRKMKMGQIKALMDVHSIPCVSCYEKTDFVNAINAWLDEKFPTSEKKRKSGAEYMRASFARDDL